MVLEPYKGGFMKITSFEKKMICVAVGLAVLLGVYVRLVSMEIEKAGGIKGIIIEAGKEIKDIKRQIEKAP